MEKYDIRSQEKPKTDKLLSVDKISVQYKTPNGTLFALRDVSLEVRRGDTIGIAGESGCGKSTLAWAVMNSLPSNAQVASGKVYIEDLDVLTMKESDLNRQVKWKKIAIIPQAAMNVFDPVYTIRDQIAETVMVHTPNISKAKARQRSEELLSLVGIDSTRADSYPHQLSGGMKQRSAIALALSLSPQILIADEPTTALDVIVQAQIMNLIMDIIHRFDLSLVLISHDLALVAQYCKKVAIMYAGRIVEQGMTTDLFGDPLHPYTLGLLRSIPNLKGTRVRLNSIPGSIPNLLEVVNECSFISRCSFATAICRSREPSLDEQEPGHFAACFESKKVGQTQR